jgi:cell division protein FtsQ
MRNQNVIYDDRIPRIKQQEKKSKVNKMFIFLLLLFFVVIILLLYFQSPFSKLSEVKISGNHIVADEQLLQQAQVELGMSVINFKSSQVQKRLEQMVEVENAEVQRIFPNKLNVVILEYPVVSYWLKDNELFPILSSGHVLLNRPWINKRVDRPILSGWPHKEGLVELSHELSKLSPAVRNTISEITLTPIVSDPYRLTLYMVDGNEVRTSIRKFAENMSWYPHFVKQVEAEGKKEAIFNLLDAKWFEDPTQSVEPEAVPPETVESQEGKEVEGDR